MQKKHTVLEKIGTILSVVFVLIIGLFLGNSISSNQIFKNNNIDLTKAEKFDITERPIIPPPPKYPYKHRFANFEKARTCLIKNVFYEGPRYFDGLEKRSGLSRYMLETEIAFERIRIINVTLNRMESEYYPDNVCAVVYQYKQFSWTLEKSKKNAVLSKKYAHNKWEQYNIKQIEQFVDRAMKDGFEDLTDGSLYYHTTWSNPWWKSSKQFKVASLWHHYYDNVK